MYRIACFLRRLGNRENSHENQRFTTRTYCFLLAAGL